MALNPEAVQPAQPETPQTIINRVNQAAYQLDQPGLSAKQKAEAAGVVLTGVFELHRQNQIAGRQPLIEFLQNKIFTNDPNHLPMAEALVEGLTQAWTANDLQNAQALLGLSLLLGINDRNKYPDLAVRIEPITRVAQSLARQQRRAVEIAAAGGEGGGGDGRPPGEPENPGPPEGFPEFRLDQLWSREFTAERLKVTKKLMELEGLTNEQLYGNEKNRKDLRNFYKQWKYLEALDTIKSDFPKPFHKIDPKELEEVPTKETPQGQRFIKPGEDDLSVIEDIQGTDPAVKKWSDKYKDLLKDRGRDDPEVVKARGFLSRYFKKGHNLGLLDAIDKELNAIVKEVEHGLDQGLSPTEILEGKPESYARSTEATIGLKKRIEGAREIGRRIFDMARRGNKEVAGLEGLIDAYIDEARDRLEAPLNENEEFEPPIPIEGGYKSEAESTEAFAKILEEEGETYWRPTYSNFFQVYARNEHQLEIAKRTFIRWARTGLGKSPNELINKANGFIEAMTSAGQRSGPEMQSSANRARLELQAIVGIFGANLFNELYNADALKQLWEYIASTPEGVDRMLALVKTSGGIMAAVLHKLSKDPRLELLHSPHGSRGQLNGAGSDGDIRVRGRNAIEMKSLQNHIISVLTSEVLGMALKEYHPEDPLKRIPKNGWLYNRNLDEITRFLSDDYFKNLYEGFDVEDQRRLYTDLHDRDARLKQFEETQKLVKEGKLPEQAAIEQPKPLNNAEKKALERLTRAQRLQLRLEAGEDPSVFTGKDREMYQEARNAVELAWEVFGAMGEKAQRGGTVYLVDRRDEEGRPFRDQIPDFWARRTLHMAENWTKATYGGELDQELLERITKERQDPKAGSSLIAAQRVALEQVSKEKLSAAQRTQKIKAIEAEIERINLWMNPVSLLADDVFYRVGQARRFATWQIRAYGRDAKLWDFTLLRNGKAVDPNTLGYDGVVDPKTGELTQWGANVDAGNEIDKYRYAVPVNERILGYTKDGEKDGEEVILVFDNDGKPKRLQLKDGVSTGRVVDLDYDEKGNAVIFDKPTQTRQWSEELQRLVPVLIAPQDRKKLIFDNLNKDTEARPMQLKVPKPKLDPETKKLQFDPITQRTILEDEPELVQVSFDNVRQRFSNHPFARFEGTPYPGYQEEWTGLLLRPDAWDDAVKIKKGLVHWNEVTSHAYHLIMIDPTFQRLGHSDIVAVEGELVRANQEESYLSEWRIGDELFASFWPQDADIAKNRTEYVLQDHGGSTKEWFHNRAQAALWVKGRARRAGPFIQYLSVDFAAYPQMYGAPIGPLDVFRMMAYGKYRQIGQFAMDKWNNQLHAAQKVLEAGTHDWYNPQREKMEEALGRKLNNDADTNFAEHYDLIRDILILGKTPRENEFQKFLVSSRDAQGRVEVYVNRNTVLQSLFRGERAPVNAEGLDMYVRRADGSFVLDENGFRIPNPDILRNMDTGSARHRNNIFLPRYARFARSPEYSALYPETAMAFSLLDRSLASYPRLAKEAAVLGRLPAHTNGWIWNGGKMNN